LHWFSSESDFLVLKMKNIPPRPTQFFLRFTDLLVAPFPLRPHLFRFGKIALVTSGMADCRNRGGLPSAARRRRGARRPQTEAGRLFSSRHPAHFDVSDDHDARD
jgi:hypothetical protein